MSILNDARQYPLQTSVDIAFGDVPGAAEVAVLDLPPNAVVTNLIFAVDTSFSGGTTHDLDIGDASDPNRYGRVELDGAAGLSATQPVITGFKTTDSEPQITVSPVHVGGDPTAGAARLIVEYIIEGRHNENQGDGLEFQGAPA